MNNVEKIIENRRRKKINKYQRVINHLPHEDPKNPGEIIVDVYDVLVAFNVTCPATAHGLKKLLCPGTRGVKGKLQDLKEAKASIERAIELEEKQTETK